MIQNTDKQVSLWIHKRGEKWFSFWEFISLYGAYLYAMYLIGVLFAIRPVVMPLIATIVSVSATFISCFVARYIIRRPRPQFMKTAYKPWLNDFSFPSMHAALVFSIAIPLVWILLEQSTNLFTVLSSIVMIVLACTISLSRIMLGVHYLLDIIAGTILGTLISLLALFLL